MEGNKGALGDGVILFLDLGADHTGLVNIVKILLAPHLGSVYFSMCVFYVCDFSIKSLLKIHAQKRSVHTL